MSKILTLITPVATVAEGPNLKDFLKMHLKVECFLLPKLNQLFLAANKTGTATYSKPYFIIRLLLLRERILIHEILLGHIYHVEKIQGNRILPHTHTLSPSSPPLPSPQHLLLHLCCMGRHIWIT